MHKVFLVDDEELVIKSLIASVDWEANGFEVAGYALSGNEALEVIPSIDPDLIFTDIRMPGISGLELIKHLKSASSHALMIVISGYAEFALAQKAINYGAFGYCLKPFDDTEIVGFLRKARNTLANRQPAKETDILECLELNTMESKNRLKNVLRSAGINPDASEGMMIVVSIGKGRVHYDGLQQGLSIPIGLRKYAYLLQANDAVRDELQRYEAAGRGIKGVGVSRTFRQVEEIQQSIQEAELNAYRYFIAGPAASKPAGEGTVKSREQLLRMLDEAAARKDISAVNACLDAAGVLFAGGVMHLHDAMTLFNQTLALLSQEQEPSMEEYIYSFDQLTEAFESVQDVLAYLKEMLAAKHRELPAAGAQKVRNRSFKAILDEVHEHFRDELTIPSLSEKFNVNANYISQLFKKETGTSFTHYLMALRIDYACRLLAETDLPINEIAEQSGYSDYFYFSRIFKRMKGTTPSGYRASILH